MLERGFGQNDGVRIDVIGAFASDYSFVKLFVHNKSCPGRNILEQGIGRHNKKGYRNHKHFPSRDTHLSGMLNYQ